MIGTEAIRAAATASAAPMVIETASGPLTIRWEIVVPTSADTFATARPHLRRVYPSAQREILQDVASGRVPVAVAEHELQVVAARAAEAAQDVVLAYAHVLAGVRAWSIRQEDGTWLRVAGRVVAHPDDAEPGEDWITLDDLLHLVVDLRPGLTSTVAGVLSVEIHNADAARHGRVASALASFRGPGSSEGVSAGAGVPRDGG